MESSQDQRRQAASYTSPPFLKLHTDATSDIQTSPHSFRPRPYPTLPHAHPPPPPHTHTAPHTHHTTPPPPISLRGTTSSETDFHVAGLNDGSGADFANWCPKS